VTTVFVSFARVSVPKYVVSPSIGTHLERKLEQRRWLQKASICRARWEVGSALLIFISICDGESNFIPSVLYRGYVLDRVHRDLRHGNRYLPPRGPKSSKAEVGKRLDTDLPVCSCGGRSELHFGCRTWEEGNRLTESIFIGTEPRCNARKACARIVMLVAAIRGSLPREVCWTVRSLHNAYGVESNAYN
jgi:hypothetical protein